MNDSGNGAVLFLRERIFRFSLAAKAFVDHRDNGAPQGMPCVVFIQEACIVGRYGNRQGAGVAEHGVVFVIREMEDAGERLHVPDAVADLPVPVTPFFVRDIREEFLSKRGNAGMFRNSGF